MCLYVCLFFSLKNDFEKKSEDGKNSCKISQNEFRTEPTTPGLQSEWFILYIIAAPIQRVKLARKQTWIWQQDKMVAETLTNFI